MHFGLRDIPLASISDETLGVKEYSESLTEFIKHCDTPLTIALQGDWGSGKTSLMNLIRENLISMKDKKIYTIWFNTWQYSQFSLQDNLAFSMLNHFIDEFKSDKAKETTRTLSKLYKFGKAAVVGLASVAGMGDAAKQAMDQLREDDFDAAFHIKKIKNNLEELVQDKIDSEKVDRIIVFIDDLDRLLPEKAVELLEVFKLFLDIPHCVYVLACDYHVVAQGLKRKFGMGSDELKGKSFFDKIIQLPFSMPLGQYDVENYIESLLKKIGIEYDKDDIVSYVDMVNYSVGFNPRTMKRLFNSLMLLNLVAEKKQLFADQSTEAKKGEKQRIMFGFLCLQMAYEPIYKYMQKNTDKINQDFFELFDDINSIKTNTDLKDILKDLFREDDSLLSRLSQFMGILYESIQLKSDTDNKQLSEKEIETLKQILKFSSLTSTDASITASRMNLEERYANRDMAKKLTEELNIKYKQYLKKLSNDEIFKIYQSRDSSDIAIYFWVTLPETRFTHEFWYTKDSIFYSSVAKNKQHKEAGKQWFEKLKEHHPDLFAETAFDLTKYYYATLWKIGFSSDSDRPSRVHQYKDEIRKTLDIIFPKLVEAKNSK